MSIAVKKYFGVFIRLLSISLIYSYVTPVWSQQQSDFEREKAAAYTQFARGQIQDSISRLQALAPKASSKFVGAQLDRDLLEICATGFFFKCYFDAKNALIEAIKSDKELAPLNPELLLYAVREGIWFNQKEFIQNVVKSGASAYIYPPAFPATYAELQLALHSVSINKNDLKTAEEMTSSAIMGLLLSDPNNTYRTCKILVGLMSALLAKQDIVGAFQLLEVIDPYISKKLSHESLLYADYMNSVGLLFTFTKNYSAAVATLTTATELYKKVDFSPEIRDFNLSGLNSLSSAALLIDGKTDEAKRMHAQHPMQSHREEIIKRGYFQNFTEFYFGLSDVLISAVSKSPPDSRWKELFEKTPIWDLSDYVLSVVNAYRSFGLACIEMGNGDRTTAATHFIEAAKKRISLFENFMRVNFEGFQLPSLVDRIVIGVAIQFAADFKPSEAADLMLRGSEILLRNLRYSIGDEAILLASQPTQALRKNAHAYINLVQQKRAWELKSIKQWLDAPNPNIKGVQIGEYTSVATSVTKLKDQFLKGSNFVQANGLPTISEIQKNLSTREVFITYFPMAAGFGRLCIDKTNSSYSFGTFAQTSISNARLLEFATTASYGPDPQLDSQYPIEAAIDLRNVLFDGIETCMKPGSHVIISLPVDLTGVPVAALLKERPPRLGEGYDLKRARWLIRDYSFSVVVSARQYLAVSTHALQRQARQEYLGIGDPLLDRKLTAELAQVFSKLDAPSKDSAHLELKEIPETANEIRTVSAEFTEGKTDILLRNGATEGAFRSKALGDYDVIHFATHGVFSPDQNGLGESALILTSGKSSGDSFDDGVLSASEIAKLSLQARLVVLSACNSAKYNQQQANLGVRDLQAAFTAAGVPTILAALWSIDSVTASDLVSHFFSNWRSGKYGGAGLALSHTIRSFLDRSDRAHQHPRFWAPFVIFGDGAVEGKPIKTPVSAGNTLKPLDALKALRDFESGGEIIDSANLGSDLILSLMGDWDGKRMAGIISSRTSDGVEKWRVTSKTISAGKVIVKENQIFAVGSKGIDQFTPVIRSIDRSGHELWTKEFPDLVGYNFADLGPSNSSIIIIAYPTFIEPAPEKTAYLLSIDRSGNEIRRVPFRIDTSRVGSATEALIQVIGGQVVVAVNSGYILKLNSRKKSVLGLPLSCFEEESVTLYYFGLSDLGQLSKRSIENFRASNISNLNNELILGGESLDGCSLNGSAAAIKILPDGPTAYLWKEDDIFPSSVRGLTVEDGLLIVVNHERAIGINVIRTGNLGAYSKRWGDDNIAIRDSSLIKVSSKGATSFRQDFSAGISVFLRGVKIVNGKPVLYGSLGGEPASTLHAKSRATLTPPLKSPSALISLRNIGIGRFIFRVQ